MQTLNSQTLDPFAPENVTRYLMLDMTHGTEFSWLSARDLYESARSLTSPTSLPPPLLNGSLINPDAARWAIKKLTGQNPGVLLFDSVADAASRHGINSILAAPVLSERSLAATVKLQQAMLFVLNYANDIIRGYDWRMAAMMLHRAKIPELEFRHAVELVTGKNGLTLDSAISIYIDEVRDKITDYLGFCNTAITAFDKLKGRTGNLPAFNIHHAYMALLILARNDSQADMNDVLKRDDIQAEMKKTGATQADVTVADRPLADIEKNMFKIRSNIFGVPAVNLPPSRSSGHA